MSLELIRDILTIVLFGGVTMTTIVATIYAYLCHTRLSKLEKITQDNAFKEAEIARIIWRVK